MILATSVRAFLDLLLTGFALAVGWSLGCWITRRLP